MKKILSVLFVLLMVLSASGTLAAEMGVQVIGGPEAESAPVSLDDLKLDTPAEIEGWGTVTLKAYEVNNILYHYSEGYYVPFGDGCKFKSGAEAEYAVLYVDILNMQLKDKDYLEDVSVKAIYDDLYEYAGWVYQLNFDYYEDYLMHEADQFAIKPMYTGHYAFGATLPNAIINGEAPLKMIITIDGNEITYNIRK